ncbi:TetR/AcrR family transcriptional regulator [Dyadobacter sp. CY345]|uniref:TetR/AcrR family transcriptional regulator n=1 Tax=Dyadobacter sp. CY345 TaxID=2909335 RepID=UPI001F30A9CB|nr:TetR/AcrR family transcriptional regulator [Dyadobacter sp. CY345]MCF2443261.1 TetR/AcrR family transcriptional regulator [Dyadobacter sp. CY345]
MGKPKAFDEDETLEKALNLFWWKGYEATSMQDIVDTLGLNRSSVYHTYTDKRTLFLRALSRYQLQQGTALSNYLTQAPATRQSLEVLLYQIIDISLADVDRKGCFTVNSTIELANRDTDVQRMVASNNDLFERVFAQFLIRMQDENSIAAHANVKQLAQFIVSCMGALRVSAIANPDRSTLTAIADGVLAALPK